MLTIGRDDLECDSFRVRGSYGKTIARLFALPVAVESTEPLTLEVTLKGSFRPPKIKRRVYWKRKFIGDFIISSVAQEWDGNKYRTRLELKQCDRTDAPDEEIPLFKWRHDLIALSQNLAETDGALIAAGRTIDPFADSWKVGSDQVATAEDDNLNPAVLPVSSGGTGSSDPRIALLNLGGVSSATIGLPFGVAPLGADGKIAATFLPPGSGGGGGSVTFPITIAQGGTNALDAATARTNLGVPSISDLSAVSTELALKADTLAVATALGLKADTLAVATALGLKADVLAVNTALALKLDTATFNTANALKLDISAFNTANALKLDISAFNTANALKLDISAFNTANALKLDISAFNTANALKLDISAFNTANALKLDISAFNTANALKVDTSTYTAGLALKVNNSAINAASGVAGLDTNSLINTAQIPIAVQFQHLAKTGGTNAFDYNTLAAGSAVIKWIDFNAGNTNNPSGVSTGSLIQYDPLFAVSGLSNLYKIQTLNNSGTQRIFDRQQANGAWGSWNERAYLNLYQNFTALQDFTAGTRFRGGGIPPITTTLTQAGVTSDGLPIYWFVNATATTGNRLKSIIVAANGNIQIRHHADDGTVGNTFEHTASGNILTNGTVRPGSGSTAFTGASFVPGSTYFRTDIVSGTGTGALTFSDGTDWMAVMSRYLTHTSTSPDGYSPGIRSADLSSIDGALRGYHILTCTRPNDATYGVQMAMSDTQNVVRFRRKTAGVWQAWATIALT